MIYADKFGLPPYPGATESESGFPTDGISESRAVAYSKFEVLYEAGTAVALRKGEEEKFPGILV